VLWTESAGRDQKVSQGFDVRSGVGEDDEVCAIRAARSCYFKPWKDRDAVPGARRLHLRSPFHAVVVGEYQYF
jgi:hypothetical protein